MEGVAVMPIDIACPAATCVPPARIITPIPGTIPCVPCVAPKPIVDHRTIDIHRLYDIVRAIDVFIAYYLNGDFVLLVFLHVYGGYVLEDIFRQDSL